MKINFMCGKCIMLASQRTNTYQLNDGMFIDMPISDSGIYDFECNTQFRHKNSILITNLKSDLLYDSAINAFNDGYLRESISSFYASLENFYIEIIKYLLSKSNISIKDRNKVIKSPMKQSERKLGAFYALFLSQINKIPPVFDEKLVGTRNNVIHGTYYPTKKDVIEFGIEIANYIFTVLNMLNEKYINSYSEIQEINLPDIENIEKYSKTIQRGYISYYQNEKNQPIKDFTSYITNYQTNKKQV